MLFSSFLFGSYLALVCSAYSWDTLSRTSLQMTMTMTLLFAYGSAMASPDYAHSNFVDSPSLFARDACSGNSNGQGSSNSTCVPSSTTCCVTPGQSYPSCEEFFGKGWCCLGNNDGDNCFVDQPSACDESGAVSCSNLQEGTSQACCSANTTCASNFTASESLVRCEAGYNYLLDSYIGNLSSATSTTSAAAAPTSTGQGSQSTTTIVGDNTGLSGGAIAGIVVGSLIIVGLIVVALWFLLRRHYKSRAGTSRQQQQQQQPDIVYQPEDKDGPQIAHSPPSYAPMAFPQELQAPVGTSELDGQTERSRSPVSPFSTDKSGGVYSPRSAGLSSLS